MHKKFLKFPSNFLWGTATSSHQVEADCGNNDWSFDVHKRYSQGDNCNCCLPWAGLALEKISPSGQACDYLNKYKQDFGFIQKMNNNAYRMSIEWARVEPEKGNFDQQAIQKYREILEDLKSRNIKIMLTLHHFTNPAWLMLEGGWGKVRVVKYFKRYTKKIVEELGDLVDLWITINEPGVYIFCGYFQDWWPPFRKSIPAGLKVAWHMARSHKKAYKLIHKISQIKFNKSAQVGFANNIAAYTNYIKHRFIDQLHVYLIYKIFNHGFYTLTGKKTHDFLGINYYFHVRLKRKKGKGLIPIQFDPTTEQRRRTDMNWLIHSHGIYEVLVDLSTYRKPIYITENGIATQDEEMREIYIHEHLEEIHHAISAGVDVHGYFYWSLLDNYEWADGYRPKFGLVEVDFKTQERRLKVGGEYYAKIARENGIWMDY